jgi:hypothetical protein
MVEFWGIIATVFVLASFLFNEERQIRTVNIIGALIFVGYGIALRAHSVWILNGVLVIVHVWKLVKMRRQKA